MERGEKDKARKDKAFKGTDARQEWVTSIECVNVAGLTIPLLVIFKSAAFNSSYLALSVLDLVEGW